MTHRVESQLPLPALDPMIRAKTIVDESMNYQWNLQCRGLHVKAQFTGMSYEARREQLEMLWFQHRCQWRDLHSDVKSELKSIPKPLPPDRDPETEEELHKVLMEQEKLWRRYDEHCHNAIYPLLMMELFQTTDDTTIIRDAAPYITGGFENAPLQTCQLFAYGSGGCAHWAQLYLHNHASMQRELTAQQPEILVTCAPQDAAHGGPIPGLPPRENSSGDLSTCSQGLSDREWASPCPSNDSFGGNLESMAATPAPTPIPHQHQVLETLEKLMAAEAPHCPVDYHVVRHDDEARANIVYTRRERKMFLIANLPRGGHFLTNPQDQPSTLR